MKTIVLVPNERKTLARAGDTGVTVQLDALAWYTEYPAGTPELMVTAPGDIRWPVTVAYADGKISGEVPDELMVRPGLYSYTFAWINAGEQVRSSPCGAIILTSETTKRWDPHSKAPDWADRIFLAAETIEAGFDGATEAADAAIGAKDTAVAAKDTAVAAKDTAVAALASIPQDYTALTLYIRGKNFAQNALTVSGSIYTDGTNHNSTAIDAAYKRTDYIKVYNGDTIKYSGLTGVASGAGHRVVAVYNTDMTLDTTLSVSANGADNKLAGSFVMTHDGYIRCSTGTGYVSTAVLNISTAVQNDVRHVGHAAISGETYPQYITDTGFIYYGTGADGASNDYKRSDYIYIPKGTKIEVYGVKAPTAHATIAVYDISKSYQQSESVHGDGTIQWHRFTMPYDGYVKFATQASEVSNVVIKNITYENTVNLLVLGNSFSQDSFAYVPKIFGELGTNINLNVCVGYNSGATIASHSTSITNDDIYTKVSMWNPYKQQWDIKNATTVDEVTTGVTASQLLARRHWDIIYVQSKSSVSNDANVRTNIVAPAKALLRQLRSTLGYGFQFVTGQWLIEKTNTTDEQRAAAMALMKRAMDLADTEVGFNDIWPIGTGIQNARTNSTLDLLGEQGSMIYDSDGHQQAGIPALISAYVIVQSLLDMLGIGDKSVYHSTFIPTDENCIAINASKADPTSTPKPMTHGTSVGVTDDNVLAAKQIAIIAQRNPFVISDCSNILT